MGGPNGSPLGGSLALGMDQVGHPLREGWNVARICRIVTDFGILLLSNQLVR